MMPKFPEFEFVFNIQNFILYLLEILVIFILLIIMCWIFRNGFFEKKYFSNCICPVCHSKMLRLRITIDEQCKDENDYIVYKCDCGYNSSPFISKLYDKAILVVHNSKCDCPVCIKKEVEADEKNEQVC